MIDLLNRPDDDDGSLGHVLVLLATSATTLLERSSLEASLTSMWPEEYGWRRDELAHALQSIGCAASALSDLCVDAVESDLARNRWQTTTIQPCVGWELCCESLCYAQGRLTTAHD